MRKKVLIPFFGNSVGGSHLVMLSLAPYLRKYTDLEIVCHSEGPLTEYLLEKKIPFSLLDYSGSSWFKDGRVGQVISIIFHLFFLIKYIRNNKIEVVHTNDARMHLLWALPCRFTNVIHVWHQHSRFPVSKLCNYLITGVKLCFVSSKFIQKNAPKNIKERVTYFCNPLTLREQPDVRSKSFSIASQKAKGEIEEHIGEERFCIVSVSNLRPVKRPAFLAEVVAEFSILFNKPIGLLHLGRDEGNYLLKMKEYWTQRLVDIKLFSPGFVEDIRPYLIHSDCLLAVARNEGYGLVLCEAMALNIPVFATESGGHIEIINDGKNGFFISVDDAHQAANKIVEVYKTENILETIGPGAKSSINNLYPENRAREMVQFYHSI